MLSPQPPRTAASPRDCLRDAPTQHWTRRYRRYFPPSTPARSYLVPVLQSAARDSCESSTVSARRQAQRRQPHIAVSTAYRVAASPALRAKETLETSSAPMG